MTVTAINPPTHKPNQLDTLDALNEALASAQATLTLLMAAGEQPDGFRVPHVTVIEALATAQRAIGEAQGRAEALSRVG